MKTATNNTYKKHKRQQTSVGLGIVTKLIDNDEYFNTKCCRSLTSSVIPYSSSVSGSNFDFISPTKENGMPFLFPEDGIIPLPSPAQIITTPSTLESIKYPSIMSRIPILSHTLSTNKTNIIPSLSEQPMLGDIDEPNYKTAMMREHNFPSPMGGCEEDSALIGKNIWTYRIKKLLGVGAFSKVFLAENIHDESQVAVKMINKMRRTTDPRIRSRGELFDFVQRMHSRLHASDKDMVDELVIKRLSLELIQIVDWLHHHNIVHRDLKLENILVYFDSNGDPHLKVTDFGLARVINPESPILSTRCGSEEYAAPEIVQGLGYDGRSTDTWAIGIILYAMLVGYLPFNYFMEKGERLSHLFHRIMRAQVNWPGDKISLESKEVVECLLKRHPEKRIKLSEIPSLPWFHS
ncbi:kinase-like protein [Backusella circina FSU 941]|nr:kinase-like protein [Backusella circina FSU 941]